jgi:hypothetical protein
MTAAVLFENLEQFDGRLTPKKTTFPRPTCRNSSNENKSLLKYSRAAIKSELTVLYNVFRPRPRIFLYPPKKKNQSLVKYLIKGSFYFPYKIPATLEFNLRSTVMCFDWSNK